MKNGRGRIGWVAPFFAARADGLSFRRQPESMERDVRVDSGTSPE